jgi:hypothetical protein
LLNKNSIQWNTVGEPGECVTLFTNGNKDLKREYGIIIRWRWKKKGNFNANNRTFINGFDIMESYENCLDIASSYYKNIPSGLEIYNEDKIFLKENHFKIEGSSLGLSFLLSLLSYILIIKIPFRTVSWGSIYPIRNNSFCVCETDNNEQKIKIAKLIKSNVILHSEKEKNIDDENIKQIRIPFFIENVVPLLIKFLKNNK